MSERALCCNVKTGLKLKLKAVLKRNGNAVEEGGDLL